MPDAGWYPDPGGRSGHYRYWDGQTWAPTTTSTLPPGPPGPAGQGGPTGPGGPRRPARRRRGLALLAAAVVVVLVVVGVLVARSLDRPVVEDGPAPSSTATGDDTTPTPTPTPTPSRSPSPSPSPSPGGPGTAGASPCPIGDPKAVQPHPQDGRVHGGGLSIPAQPGWASPGAEVTGFSWTYDLGETDVAVQPSWYAAYAVGALAVSDGFEDPRSAAELSMECTASSFFYRGITSRTDLVSEATTVDGYRAWTIRSEIRISDQRSTFTGDTVQVTVVDLDSPDALAFFWGSAPIGDQAYTDRLDRVARALRAD